MTSPVTSPVTPPVTPLDNLFLVLAETSRSKAYAQVLGARGLLPRRCLLLRAGAARLPGQEPAGHVGPVAHVADEVHVFEDVCYRPGQPLEDTLAAHGVALESIGATDINSEPVIEALSRSPERIAIYSGYGGAILRAPVLGLGVQFLHAHGGWLPQYKGSTTNYYSLLAEGCCGASVIVMTEQLDGGPVLHRRRFPPPPNPALLDHVYDPLYRAIVMADAVQHYVEHGAFAPMATAQDASGMYYIMHPLLRHVCILGMEADGIVQHECV